MRRSGRRSGPSEAKTLDNPVSGHSWHTAPATGEPSLVLTLKTGGMLTAHLLSGVKISKFRNGERMATRLVHQPPVPTPVLQLANANNRCGRCGLHTAN